MQNIFSRMNLPYTFVNIKIEQPFVQSDFYQSFMKEIKEKEN